MLSTSDGAQLNASLTSHQLFNVIKIQLISFLFSSSQAGMPTSGASDTGHRSAEGCWGTIPDFFLVFFNPNHDYCVAKTGYLADKAGPLAPDREYSMLGSWSTGAANLHWPSACVFHNSVRALYPVCKFVDVDSQPMSRRQRRQRGVVITKICRQPTKAIIWKKMNWQKFDFCWMAGYFFCDCQRRWLEFWVR